MNFTYQARDIAGQIRDGEIIAASIEEATRQLRQEGMYLLSLQERVRAAERGEITLFQKRPGRSEIVYLTNQLAVMTDAGVPLATAIEGLAKQAENPVLKQMLTSIQHGVEGGENLSTALARFPREFDQTYVNLVKASEASGLLGPMLERIASQMQAELETRQKVRAALAYPALMLVMSVGVSVFLLAYVFPKLMPMFETRALDLPTPTKVMMTLSLAITGYWPWLLVGLAAVIGGFLWGRKQPWGRKALDWFWLNVPVLGPMLRKVTISRSVRTLATTVNAGVPVLESLELCAGVSGNVYYERCWRGVAEQVAAGRQIHDSLEGNPLFPATLLQMIASGETTGQLGPVLTKVSDYFDRDVATAVKGATSLIEPVMVLVMGTVIGTIALAMLLPIFKLSSHVG